MHGKNCFSFHQQPIHVPFSFHQQSMPITQQVQLWPELAGRGRYFSFGSQSIPASIRFFEETPLCTTLCKDGHRVRTVEHLLSALEAIGANNCRIEIDGSNSTDKSVEVPNLDGSAREWVQAIKETGLKVASDQDGGTHDKVAPQLNEPVLVFIKDAFVAVLHSPSLNVTCGIDFPQVEKMLSAGLIKKGRSIENAIPCSSSKGWLNPTLRFSDEPCRHKVLDLIGDLSLFGACGSQGLLVAHIVAYKAGRAIHADVVRRLSQVG